MPNILTPVKASPQLVNMASNALAIFMPPIQQSGCLGIAPSVTSPLPFIGLEGDGIAQTVIVR